jgi:hypothetical protein
LRFRALMLSPWRRKLCRLVQRQQGLQRGLIALVTNAFAALLIDLDIGLGARPVVVQTRVQILPIEAVDGVGMARVDIAVADVFADHRAILGLTSPLSPLCRGRLLVCSISSLSSSLATVALMNSLPLSVWRPLMRNGNWRSMALSTGSR